jgi:hypothetical protein
VRTRLARGLALGVLSAALVACGGGDRSPEQRPLELSWYGTDLPAPAGERPVARAATWCAGQWVVVGATATSDGGTKPAVWTSRDAREWQSTALHPGRDFYTAREILDSVACSRGRVAAIGAKSGGAHGMPRTATWRQLPDGSLAAVPAPSVLFGGSEGVSVGAMAGGPEGYLLAGTRTSGAAVWWSPEGGIFRLYAGAPGLASTSRLRTQAADALPAADGWLVAGQVTEPDGRLRGVVWSGDPGSPWHRSVLPGGTTISTAERLAAAPPGPDVAGLLDNGFGLWGLRNESWRLLDRFGASDPDGSNASYVSGLAESLGRVAATYSDGAHFRLWVGEDVPMPTEVTVDGDRSVTVASHGRHLLLLTDDDRAGRAWLATVPRPTL